LNPATVADVIGQATQLIGIGMGVLNDLAALHEAGAVSDEKLNELKARLDAQDARIQQS
jgi:hypothetical protein